MAAETPTTCFARPDRVSEEVMRGQRTLLDATPVVGTLLDSFPEPAAVINDYRQIVRANDKLRRFSGAADRELLGLRMGEALGCRHADEEPAGCGTTAACALCGAARAIETTVTEGAVATDECRILLDPRHGGDPLDLRVWTTPLHAVNGPFIVFAVRDTSDEQRRRVLERLFFHDVLNTAGGLRNILQIWPALSTEEAIEFSARIEPLAAQVVEEIEAQRDLAAAERGELTARDARTDVTPLLDDLVTLYRHHTVGDQRFVVLEKKTDRTDVVTDAVLLRRVLGNLVKNALEASAPGGTVRITFSRDPTPVFTVHNETVMPEAVRLQVFQRSFSTKGGRGRGVGTYSARLLSEKYLRGRLTFESREGAGTTFTLELPSAQEAGS